MVKGPNLTPNLVQAFHQRILFSKAECGLLTKIRFTQPMYLKAWYARNPYIIVIYRDFNKLHSEHLQTNIDWDNIGKPDEKHI